MEMKKIACGVLFAAASMSAVLAATEAPEAATGAPAAGPGPDAAGGPAESGALAALPVLGSLVGASLMSLFTYYLQ